MSINTERRGSPSDSHSGNCSTTIMVAGGFSIVSAERRSVADQKSQISAFRIAEQGLEIFLIRRDSLLKNTPGYSKIPGVVPDSARITVAGGYADVSLTADSSAHQ